MEQRRRDEKLGSDEFDRELSAVESRRRLLRRSLTLAAPVVATLVSPPVSAGTCALGSAFLSTTHASHKPLVNCAGRSPSGWAALADVSWPAGVTKNNPGGTRFNATFGTDLAGNPLLVDVLATYDSTPATAVQQAGAVTALWLNAKAGLTGGVFTPASVLAIWENIVANAGGYQPASGPALTPQQTHNWLAQTWA